jgi:hypothetical protein
VSGNVRRVLERPQSCYNTLSRHRIALQGLMAATAAMRLGSTAGAIPQGEPDAEIGNPRHC